MIEDDLRELLAPAIGVPVYSRQLPPNLPDCVCIQNIGGLHTNGNIRRAVHFISVLACSRRIEDARQYLNSSRNFFTTHLPADINGTHYYVAIPQADGELLIKPPRGPVYILHVTMEVTREQ